MNKNQAIVKMVTEINHFLTNLGYDTLDGDNDIDDVDETIKVHIVSYLRLNATNASNKNNIYHFINDLLTDYCGNQYDYDWFESKKYFRTFVKNVIKIHSEYKGKTVKSTLKSQKVKDVSRKVIVRKVARNVTNKCQKFLIDYLDNGNILADSALKIKISNFLATDIGRGIFAGAIGLLLDLIPAEKLPGGESIAGVLSEVSDELKVQAGDQITVPLEGAVVLLLPMLKETLMPLLTQADIKQLSK